MISDQTATLQRFHAGREPMLQMLPTAPGSIRTACFWPLHRCKKAPAAGGAACQNPNGSRRLRLSTVAVKRAPRARAREPNRGKCMPEVIFTGAAGRIEGRYH